MACTIDPPRFVKWCGVTTWSDFVGMTKPAKTALSTHSSCGCSALHLDGESSPLGNRGQLPFRLKLK